jgi:transposase InsO family protein
MMSGRPRGDRPEALARHGRPEIFITYQGSQFTGEAFAGLLSRNEIATSMDGKGARRDAGDAGRSDVMSQKREFR